MCLVNGIHPNVEIRALVARSSRRCASMNILQKRDLTPQDIQWLIDNQVQEGSDLEFKEALSTRWCAASMGDQHAVGDEAKSDIVKELVGFANAQGGR